MFKRFIFIFILVLVLPLGTHAQKDLLNFLIEHNDAAREKIKTAQYKVKWIASIKVDEGLRQDKGFGEVKIKGDWRYSTQECNASIPATGWKQKQTQRMVINDKYLTYWPRIGNAYIYQDDHQSLKELSDDIKLRRNLHTTPDIYSFSFAFGGGKDTTFKDMMKLHPDEIRWTAEQAKQPNGDTVYLIKRYSPYMNDSSKPDGVWTIDPQKGFLVTQAVFYSRAGDVWITRTIESKEFGSGIWIPVTYQEQYYGNPDAPRVKEKPDIKTIQLEDISINEEISDENFTIDAIFPEEYRDTTTVFRKGLDGNTEAYIYKYGRYIPRKEQYNIGQLAESLKGKPLPSFDNIQINHTKEQLKGKSILICFFDMQQRPSRNCVIQLAEREKHFKKQGITVIAIHASKIEQSTLDEWIKDNNIVIPIGMVVADAEKTRFNWGVKSLPWLILTDKKHVVIADGFGFEELDEIMNIPNK